MNGNEVYINGTIIHREEKYPATFFVDFYGQDDKGGIFVVPWETDAPDNLVPWGFYVYRNVYRYTSTAGTIDDPLIEVEIVFPPKEIEKVFERGKQS